MRLHDKLPLLAALEPDVAVVPECANIDILRRKAPLFVPPSAVWVGDIPNKGLGVFGFGDFRVTLDSCYDPSLTWVAPIRVDGPIEFHMLAVCALHSKEPGETRKDVVGPLLRALDRFGEFLTAAPLVVIGDFNNHVQWDKQGKMNNHANVVERLAQLGLFSAYHYSRSIPQGQEIEPTIYWQTRTKDGQTFHIDHCFLPTAWQSGLRRFEVGSYEDWTGKGHSDHVPIVADIALPNCVATP
jgi:hypothetical protein